MSSVRFPLMFPGGQWERRIKIAAGLVLLRVFARRAQALVNEGLPENPGRLDWLLIAGLLHRHRAAGTLDRLQKWHGWLWGGADAVAFHRMAEARFATWWRGGHDRILRPMEEVIETHGLRHLCEIGCGSGLVLADLAERLPDVPAFTGLDLSREQTSRNRERFAGRPELRFESGDAVKWIPHHLKPGVLLFTNAGVLEYFAPDALRNLLRFGAESLAPCGFAMVEPIYEGFDPATATESRICGGENSYSHPYPFFFQEAGWVIVHQEEIVVEGYRWLLLVARTRSTQ